MIETQRWVSHGIHLLGSQGFQEREFTMVCGLCGKGTSTESCGNTEEGAMEEKRVQESETSSRSLCDCRCRTRTLTVLMYNSEDCQLPLRIGGGDVHKAYCSVCHSISTKHTPAVAHRSLSMRCSVHPANVNCSRACYVLYSQTFVNVIRHLLSTATVCQALFWGLGVNQCTTQTHIPPLLNLHSVVGKQFINIIHK